MNHHDTSTRPAPSGRSAMPRRWLFFPRPVAWVVLGISLLASAGGCYIAWKHAELEARKRFDEGVGQISAALSERMQVYQDVLHGAVGLYAASASVERDEWRAYVESVSLNQRFPGMDALGFVACVRPDNVEEFLRITRADKSPRFQLKDGDTTNDLFVVKYMEPEARHRSLIGWNMAVEAERRMAAERAALTGEPTVSGVVSRRGLTDDRQSVCLMLLPVYRRGLPTSTPAERRAAVEGWVFARIVIDQLMRPLVDTKDPGLHFRVADATGAKPADFFFDEDPELTGIRPDAAAWFATEAPSRFGGRTWILHFSTKPAFEAAGRRGSTLWVGAAGSVISLLLFSIAWSLSYTRERALAIAGRMTGTLRETNERLEAEISERKRSEDALKHSEALYHSLVESLPLSITRKDLQGRLTFANRRFCTRYNKTPAELIGQSDAHLFPPEVAARRQAADDQVLTTGTTMEMVEERPQPDGTRRYVQAIRTPLYDANHKIIGLLGIFWDVTDKRRAEAELEHERFLLRTLMDNLPDRIYFKDDQSRFLRNSRGHLQRFNLTDPKDALGKTDFDFFSEEHARQAYDDEQRLMRTGETVSKEEKETWPDGSITWALSTKMPLRDESGKTIGTFGISHDITDRKRAEEAMREAKEAAEEANRAKSQFLASMSHELRTPLNSVIGFANILLKNKSGALSAAELNFLDRILANGKHLLSLINEILDLSKIEAHRVELQLGTVALDVLIRETIAQQEGLVRDKPIQLLADVPARVAPIVADADKLKQVLINLIGNALKFTEQGSVTVRLITEPDANQPVRIDVVDTGIGIPQEKLGVIFEAFQQAEAGTTRKYGGTGLGLTISRALCQLMGYRIEVSSEVGRGSTFSIVFGLKAAPPAPKPVAAAGPAPFTSANLAELQGKLVLVIDDELDSRTLLTHMLGEFGCRAVAATSGEEGLRLARVLKPQLITVDLMMPQLNGWEVIRALKADPDLRDIPVVVVSIVAGENRGGVLGAVELLQKPVQREDLLAVLRRTLPAAHPRVLIVDDEDDARQVLAGYLKDEACQFQTAANGREALTLLEDFTPDLILLDLMMPVMDGMTFLRELRANRRFEWVPVVVVTAKELTPDEAAQLRRTAQEVVRKGDLFDAGLKNVLRRLLQRPS